MDGQSQIQRRLRAPESVERVQRLVAQQAGALRTELADLVCDGLGFFDRQGRRQRSGCLKALRILESRGRLVLPTARTKPGSSRPRRLCSSVPLAEGVPEQVDGIRELELVPVDNEQLMRVWNTLLLDEHPRGAGPLVGRQLRYLVRSEHGWLGALGFAAAALHLQARDRWIGWDLETRRAQLDRVVGLSRFLIRGSVQCRNLASRVLGLVMARLPRDFKHRYGYRPWLVETFVDTTQYAGTCFQAASWIRVGCSQGRGRQDREADLFELFDAWRQGPCRTELLIRAINNRKTTDVGKLLDAVRSTPPRLWIQLHISRQSARPKKSKQKARPKRAARLADMTLRSQPFTVPPPRRLGDTEPLSLWLVHAVEENPLPDVKPIEWFVLTTMAITSPEQAARLLAYYCLRWRIEDWHRVLKTGCRIEKLRNESAHRRKRALAIHLVIAWRVMLMALLGREEPGLPPEVLFSDLEIEVLTAFAKSRRDLKPPERLGDAVRLTARLGGSLDRKSDPPPGHQVTWRGYAKLRVMCEAFLLFRQADLGLSP